MGHGHSELVLSSGVTARVELWCVGTVACVAGLWCHFSEIWYTVLQGNSALCERSMVPCVAEVESYVAGI